MPRYVSFFSGAGMFDVGLRAAGWTCAGACEIDAHARRVYEKNHGRPAFWPTDITKVRSEDVPDADLWVGGFPCQDVSVAGKRAGLGKGTRSGLVYTLLDLAAIRQPEWIVLENVPGLLNVNDGDCFEALLDRLAEIGYLVDVDVLDAQNFGVAQRRKRMFFVCQRARGLLKRTHASDATLLGILASGLLATLDEQGALYRTDCDSSGGQKKAVGLQRKMLAFGSTSEPSLWLNLPSWLDDLTSKFAIEPTAFSVSPLASAAEENTPISANARPISSSWKAFWEEHSTAKSRSTTSTGINTTTTPTTCSCAKMLLPIIERIGRSWDACPLCYEAAHSALIASRACMLLLREASNDLFQSAWFREAGDLLRELPRAEARFLARRSGNGPHPREVLLESQGMRRRAAPGRAAGAEIARDAARGARDGVAGTIGSHATGGWDPADLERCGALVASDGGPDDSAAQAGHLVAATLRAGHGRGDRSAAGDGNAVTYRNSKCVSQHDDDGTLVFNSMQDPISAPDLSPCIGVGKWSTTAVAFDMAQVTHPENRAACTPGGPAPTLTKTGTAHVAFIDAWATRGSCSPNQHPVKQDGLSDALDTTGPGAVFPTLRGFGHGWQGQQNDDASRAGMVRRLTPIECERLMGLPDGYTCLCGCAPYSTMACRCPDGPRYRLIGNGGVTHVLEWIGRRLAAAIR